MPIIFFVIAIFVGSRRRAARALAAAPAIIPATPLSTDAQWSRVTGIISTSIDRTAVTQRYHAAAEDQLDAAAYALKDLIRELSDVMTVPAARSGVALYHLPTTTGAADSAPRRRASAA